MHAATNIICHTTACYNSLYYNKYTNTEILLINLCKRKLTAGLLQADEISAVTGDYLLIYCLI